MSLRQQSNNAIKSDLRSKRLRHVHLISAKSLKILADKFEVWFTLHLTDRSKAFYISEKRENDDSPKWYPLNGTQLPYKSFIVRVWVKDLKNSSLSLFLNMNVHLDGLVISQISKNVTNMLIFEIFGKQYCENLQDGNFVISTDENEIKKRKISYSLNLMTRLHDFQRVSSSFKFHDFLSASSFLNFYEGNA